LVLTPLYNETGKLQGFFKLVRDITEYQNVQDNLATKAKELEAANKSKDNFLAVLSHELRNPLVAILGYSNMMLSGRLGVSEQKKALETIARNAKLQVNMIEDLLDISRIVAGKISLQKGVFPVCQVVHDAVETFRPAALAKGLNLKAEFRDLGIFIDGDPRRMQQIVLNLLSNAVKFTDSGGEIKVSVYCADNHAHIEVKDTGIGIAADKLPHVFDRFRQVSEADTRKHGGLGLGLSIVKTLTKLHGGTVTAESEGEGKGSTFTVRVPSCEGDPKNIPNFDESELEKTKKRSVKLNGIKLLVVDDSDETRQLLSDMFKIYGANVVSAESAEEARRQIKESNHFDVFVLDIGMPGESGYSLIRSLREMGYDTPALALTAFVGPEYQQAAIAAGFQDYLPKPPSMDYLLRRISELAGK
jgi:CheY-like chemotaxis protein